MQVESVVARIDTKRSNRNNRSRHDSHQEFSQRKTAVHPIFRRVQRIFYGFWRIFWHRTSLRSLTSGIDAEVASTHASSFAPGTAFRTTFTSLRTKEESLHQGGFRTSSSMVPLTAITDFAFVRSKACKRLNPSRNRPNTSTPAERTARATQTSIKVKPFFISSSIQRLATGPKRMRVSASNPTPIFQHFQATSRTKDTDGVPFAPRSGTAPLGAPQQRPRNQTPAKFRCGLR